MILAQSVYTCKDTILTCAIEEQSLCKYLRGALPKHYSVPAIPLQVHWPITGYFNMLYIDDLRWGEDDPWMVRAWDFDDEPHRRFMLYWYDINSNVVETTEF